MSSSFKITLIIKRISFYLCSSSCLLIIIRLIASGRLIEFESINRSESWRFGSIRLESLGSSIPKVGTDNSDRIVSSESRIDSKKSIRIAKTFS